VSTKSKSVVSRSHPRSTCLHDDDDDGDDAFWIDEWVQAPIRNQSKPTSVFLMWVTGTQNRQEMIGVNGWGRAGCYLAQAQAGSSQPRQRHGV
jgi:hypothetical protein